MIISFQEGLGAELDIALLLVAATFGLLLVVALRVAETFFVVTALLGPLAFEAGLAAADETGFPVDLAGDVGLDLVGDTEADILG